MELLVFNPEHDYALADNQPQYVTLRSAAQFAYDCAPFMRYLAEDGAVVLDAYRPFGKEFQKNFDPMEDAKRITKVTPWGWDAAVVYQLRRIGIPDKLLPTDAQLSKLRDLAHRKTAITAMEFLHDKHPHPELLPSSPSYLTELQQVEDFVKRIPDAIFKSPYSGNGRGHLYAHGTCTPTLLRQCAGVLRRQGGIIVERMYAVVQDFAMEFHCHDGQADFIGYSLFQTEHYGYGGNLLLPDDAILSALSQYIGIQEILQTQTFVRDFLRQHIATHYDGVAGVDMFVYREDGTYKLHPFVEVNLRMTMGLAAHEIFRRYCHPDARGTFRIVREVVETRRAASLQTEMQLRDGLWWSGTMALNPVTAATRYAVVMELNDSN
jgi:hypothetical protein